MSTVFAHFSVVLHYKYDNFPHNSRLTVIVLFVGFFWKVNPVKGSMWYKEY